MRIFSAPVPAPLPRGGSFRGFRNNFTFRPISGTGARKGTKHGTPDFLSNNTDRWAVDFLQGGGAERRADAFVAARTSVFVANVRAAGCAACGPLSPGGAGLSGP